MDDVPSGADLMLRAQRLARTASRRVPAATRLFSSAADSAAAPEKLYIFDTTLRDGEQSPAPR